MICFNYFRLFTDDLQMKVRLITQLSPSKRDYSNKYVVYMFYLSLFKIESLMCDAIKGSLKFNLILTINVK